MTPTLVLVHGGTVTSTMWDPVLEHLRTPARAVDLPGRRYHPADLSTGWVLSSTRSSPTTWVPWC